MVRVKGRELEAPVHLILHGETLYIGASGTGSILALDLTSTPPRGKLKALVQLRHIIPMFLKIYCNFVHVLSGSNSVNDFATLTLSVPKFFA
jgi:hypothetical protein